MADIHKYKQRLKRTLERVDESKDISIHNKKLILEFHDNCLIQGLSFAKIERYVYDAFRLAQQYAGKLDLATEKDLKRMVADVEKKEWTISTKQTFKLALRKFYKFVDDINEKGVSPERLKWMKTHIRRDQRKAPEDLITEEDIELLIRNATCKRDMAFIASLSESGCRIGELGSLKIKDVTFDEYGARIQVFGKTGSRVVRLMTSAPYLRDWINKHPFGNDRTRYLWITNIGDLISDSRMSSILKNSARRAGVNKRIYPHLFRHSRATFLAGHLTESQMKNCLGWTAGSDMAGIYVHLNGKDADKAILKMNGVEMDEEKRKIKLQPKECGRCKTINESTNKFCKVCGFVLDKEESENILKEEAERTQADEIMNKLVNDPEILELLKKKLRS